MEKLVKDGSIYKEDLEDAYETSKFSTWKLRSHNPELSPLLVPEWLGHMFCSVKRPGSDNKEYSNVKYLLPTRASGIGIPLDS